MKTVKFVCLWICFLALIPNLFAQVKEIPVTTSSEEALNFYTDGRDKNEDGEMALAAALFDKAIEKDPAFALAYMFRAFSGGSYEVYMKNMQKAVSLADMVSPGEKQLIYFYEAMALGNQPRQKEMIGELLKSFPGDKRVHLYAAYYYANQKEYAEALAQCKKATELDNTFAAAYNMTGYAESSLKNYPAAEKAFQNYIRLRPDKANPYDSYGELLLRMGKYDESIAQYKKALEKDPKFVNSMVGMGNNYIFKGDYSAARKYYQTYYDKSPDVNSKLDALWLKALSYLYESKTDEALRVFDERFALAEKENQVPVEIFSLADQRFICTETGNPAEGMKYCEKAINLLEKSNLEAPVKESITRYSKGWYIHCLIASGEFDKAMAEMDKYQQAYKVQDDPGEIKGMNFYSGRIALKKGNPEKAISYFAQSDTIQSPYTWYCMASAYAQKGDKKNAKKYYEKIAKLNANSLDMALFRNRAIAELKK